MRHVPNLLSVFRLVAAPVLLVLAGLGAAPAFIALLAASLASDALDGWWARRFGVASPLGAKLDSWGDLATYSVLPLAVFWLWPEVVLTEVGIVAVALVAYALPILCGLIKFRRLTSYHTWGAKASSVAMAVGLFSLFAGGPAWPFHAAVALLVAEAIEELAITWLLPAWRADVPTLWHARKLVEVPG